MVPSWADQLLPQLLMDKLILCLYNVDTLNICMKEFGSVKIIFDKMTAVIPPQTLWNFLQNDSCENLDNFFPNKVFVCA